MATATTAAAPPVITSGRRDDGAPLSSGRDRALPIAVVALVSGFVAMFVYGRAAGYVYTEDSDFALEFGHHSFYHALSFSQILGKYFTISHGWYRPTGFYLIPYLLRIDYFQPAEQVNLDIATMVIVGALITVFFKPRILTAVAASLSVLLAPALYQVTYGVQADSFYIIFGLVFLWLADRLHHGTDVGGRRRALQVALVFTFMLTITTKEAGCLVALLMIPFLLVKGPELSWARIWRAVRFALPFLVVVVGFFVVFSSQVSKNSTLYATGFHLSRLLDFISLLSWTVGFRSPRHTFSNFIPDWTTAETIVRAIVLAVTVGGLALTWRRFGLWRIGLVLLAIFGTSVAIADVGGIPYHSYPIIVMYTLSFLAVMEAVADRLTTVARPTLRRALTRVAGVGLVGLILAQILQGHSTYGGVIDNGPQSWFLEASTELFDGPLLAPVRHSTDPLFIFQDCLGGLDNALVFYARSPTGSEIDLHAPFVYSQLEPQMEAARRAGRPVFAALCTNTTDPWYELEQYMGPQRGMVAAPDTAS